jgi:hypothetical protein
LWYNSLGGLKVPEIETKVSKLEEVLHDFIVNVERAHLRTEAKLEKLHTEIEEFKESTLRFQEESEKDRRELRESLERYKAEAEKDRRELRESLERYKAEAEKDRRELRESFERYKAEAEKDRKEMQESFERYKAEAEKDRREMRESFERYKAEAEKDRRELRESFERYKAEAEKDRKEMRESFERYKKELQESFERYKAEAEKDRKEMREEIKGLNKKWGELANKMGTITEDLIAPALKPVLDKYFRCNPIMEGQRIRRRINGEHYEVDAIAVCDDKVFMIEERSTPKFHHVDEIKKKSERFLKFFPEHKDKELIVIFGSITFPPDVIQEASKKGIYVMGWREWEYMDILNFEEVKRG